MTAPRFSGERLGSSARRSPFRVSICVEQLRGAVAADALLLAPEPQGLRLDAIARAAGVLRVHVHVQIGEGVGPRAGHGTGRPAELVERLRESVACGAQRATQVVVRGVGGRPGVRTRLERSLLPANRGVASRGDLLLLLHEVLGERGLRTFDPEEPGELAGDQALRFRAGALHGPEGSLALVLRLALAELRLRRNRRAVSREERVRGEKLPAAAGPEVVEREPRAIQVEPCPPQSRVDARVRDACFVTAWTRPRRSTAERDSVDVVQESAQSRGIDTNGFLVDERDLEQRSGSIAGIELPGGQRTDFARVAFEVEDRRVVRRVARGHGVRGVALRRRGPCVRGVLRVARSPGVRVDLPCVEPGVFAARHRDRPEHEQQQRESGKTKKNPLHCLRTFLVTIAAMMSP